MNGQVPTQLGWTLLAAALAAGGWVILRALRSVNARHLDLPGAPQPPNPPVPGTLIQPIDPPAPATAPPPDTDELLAAIALALHLDRLALAGAQAQRLTWSRLATPFSPWMMDAKTSLHSRRIRWRPAAAPGVIVRSHRH